jgi:hypothetical protein
MFVLGLGVGFVGWEGLLGVDFVMSISLEFVGLWFCLWNDLEADHAILYSLEIGNIKLLLRCNEQKWYIMRGEGEKVDIILVVASDELISIIIDEGEIIADIGGYRNNLVVG